MTSALEQSFKKRLQIIAKERNLTSAQVWQNVITERFLVRLCRSSYHAHFVLKGGMLLARYVDIGRETKDLDFAIQGFSNELGGLQKVFEEIMGVESRDGFVFTNPVVTQLEHFHMQYSGAQVQIEVHFGKSKFPLFVDLGFGDLVQRHEKDLLLLSNSKGPLFEPSLTINCYPIEFIFAEKLETVVFRGINNSRMKDFHDLYTIINSRKTLNELDVVKAIRLVFEHRKTPLHLPMEFDSLGLETLQKYWGRYHKTTSMSLPNQIAEIIQLVNNTLEPLFASISSLPR
jgi:predicted nucleotidyltransferase component of viral defense system